MSATYGATLIDLIQRNSKVVDVESDLGRAILGPEILKTLKTDYPRQMVDCGIQEANMIGVAAGLSAVGRIPFTHTFAAFASRRIADQVFVSGCYSRANIRVVGTDPGVTAAFNGGTHMPFEDIGIFRSFPGMTILDPSDNTMLAWLLEEVANNPGMYYIRLFRKTPFRIYEAGTRFKLGRAVRLREGSAVTIIAEGVMVAEALRAAARLTEEGIAARVLDMFTIKPLDAEAVIQAARETGALVTAENHSRLGGLGSAVAEVLATGVYAPLEMVGVRDRFGEVGPMDFLMKRFGLTADDIAAAAKRAIARKGHESAAPKQAARV
ncbi:MAG: hypothetical protein LUE17_09645 [Planctomycetaceae bacterium]|nr:hypothetical protein [Planctomycetaceae bacterium]